MQILSVFNRIKLWVNKKIQRRMIVWSGSFWALSIIILSLVFLLTGENQILAEARQRNVQLASMISRDVNTKFGNIIGETRTFTQRLETLGPDLYKQADELLGLRLSSTRYSSIYYFDKNDTLLIHLTDSIQSLVSVKDTKEILNRQPVSVGDEIINACKAVKSTSIYISDIYYTPLDYNPVLYIGMPIKFNTGETRTIVFEVNLTDIWRSIEIVTVGQTGFAYVVSHEGIIIAHPEPSHIGSLISPEIMPVLKNYEGSAQFSDSLYGKEILASFSPVGGFSGWGIVVSQDMGEIYAGIEKAGSLTILILLILSIVGTVSILIFVGNFSRPIKELTQTAQNIANTGNLVKIELSQRSDEIGQLSQSFNHMIEKVKNTENQRENAAANERNRLARDLHDAVSQTLFSASLIAEVLPKIWDRSQAEGRKRLEELRQLTRGALAEMRTLLLELRPVTLVEARLEDLLKQLSEATIGRARIPVSLKLDECRTMPSDLKIAFYRITQEAINNISKHSGASNASIELRISENYEYTVHHIELLVSDNGRGFDKSQITGDHQGLGIMKERADAIGAEFVVDSAIGKGTQILVRWIGNY